ncbi:MAG: hypothetical protein WCP91_01380 [Candidatus Berkelbacteria bacterium]
MAPTRVTAARPHVIWHKPQATRVTSDQAYVEIHHRLSFRILVAAILVVALSFCGYVKYQEEVNHNFLQVGPSLAPVVPDYFSWSHEVPMKPEETPVVGEYYTYRRPAPDYSEMNIWQRSWVKLYEAASGGRTATKQCHGVSTDGQRWNTFINDKWVLRANTIAHVTEIYDRKSYQLSKTPEGRMRLWVERHHIPQNTHWLDNGDVEIRSVADGKIRTYRSSINGPVVIQIGSLPPPPIAYQTPRVIDGVRVLRIDQNANHDMNGIAIDGDARRYYHPGQTVLDESSLCAYTILGVGKPEVLDQFSYPKGRTPLVVRPPYPRNLGPGKVVLYTGPPPKDIAAFFKKLQ